MSLISVVNEHFPPCPPSLCIYFMCFLHYSVTVLTVTKMSVRSVQMCSRFYRHFRLLFDCISFLCVALSSILVFHVHMFLARNRPNGLGRCGSLVDSTPFVRRAAGSNPALAAK